MYLHENEVDWRELVKRASKRYSLDVSFVAKDYFIFLALKLISSKNPDVVFKGGTCLSKCHKAINRFSEDIDLGMEVRHATEGQRKKMKSSVVSAVEEMGLEIVNLSETKSKREFNKYIVPLPPAPDGLQDDILIVETAVMTPSTPSVVAEVDNYVYRLCAQDGFDDVIAQYGLEPFSMKANSMERTFADKVFAVCDYYLSGEALDRQSRHIYDLHKLLPTVELNRSMADLIIEVRNQRRGKSRCHSAEDGVSVSATLREIATLHPYRNDYEKITARLLYEEVPYEKALTALLAIADYLESACAL